jgi:mannose-1-phosphate guanylyltransferase / mannose-6-phosphate isomerase
MIIPVILSGGAGSRLWPLSRELYPKQLLPLVNEWTMLQNSVQRLDGIESVGQPMVVCNESHRFMVAEQLRQIGRDPAAILLEPSGRNTAPAVALAALHASKDDDPVLLVLPADHVIPDIASFHSTVALGYACAKEGRLVLFGIVPRAPETGYGYIKRGEKLNEGGGETFEVERFAEKPDLKTAREYASSGEYYWNSGMFMFRAGRYLQELERFAPEILSACKKAYAGAVTDLDFTRVGSDAFGACPSDSIDYAVMEKTSDAVMIPLDAGWNDVGSWSALWEIGQRDAQGNVIAGDVLNHGSRNCYLHAASRMIAAVGVENHVVVETADAVLVASRDRVQDVKEIVARLKESQREEALLHRKVFRPWGSYEGIASGQRFQVKRIIVNPGASLSLQMHHHRAEHWIVVKGTASVTNGDKAFLLTENQSTYIPIGESHRLENPGMIPLEIIEVQSGSYLGEDDIVRFDDLYGR